jgi:hypothetical protein
MNCSRENMARWVKGRKSDSQWQRHLRSRAASQMAAEFCYRFTQGGALTDSRLPWAIFGRPYQGFQFVASQKVESRLRERSRFVVSRRTHEVFITQIKICCHLADYCG